MKRAFSLLAALLSLAVIAGCRGTPSARPPVHIVPDMDRQPRLNAQSTSDWFADGAAMRVPPAGTVPRGNARADRVLYEGRADGDTNFVDSAPIPATMSSLRRGAERYAIYCAVCHGQTGDGKGIMIQRGYVPPPTFHSDLIRGYSDGRLFDLISNGVRNMPAYRYQIPVEDRWHIVNYMRALQRSQNSGLTDVPPEQREKLR